MNIAPMNDFDSILTIFQPYKKTYFSHIRQDYIKRNVEAGKVILEDGVVIIYNVYKRRQKIGNAMAQRGDVHLMQIASASQGNGNASRILNDFFREMGTNVWLSVRSENSRARAFYEKNKMIAISDISWANGKVPGVVYLYGKETQ